jgi:hypothetical protein
VDEKKLMKTYNFLLYSCLSVVCAIWTACVFCGCQQAELEPPKKEKQLEPVFFPPFPDKPRLQFLRSFYSFESLWSNEGEGDQAKSGWFEEFIVGTEDKQPQLRIVKPYGTAMYDGKLYVCDIARGVLVLDFKSRTHSYLTDDSRLINPINIFIDNGNKYVCDPRAPGVFVFDKSDKLTAIFSRLGGNQLVPLDVAVRGQRCYVTEQNSRQVIVLDKVTGEEISRIGKPLPEDSGIQQADENAQFKLIGDLAFDQEGNLYVTDRMTAQISKFDTEGRFVRTFGGLGGPMSNFIRPKGIAIDREDRMWVVDAATQMCKIYDAAGLWLLYFGMGGNRPGMMYVPATVTLDYDHVDLFKEYAVEGAKLEFLVIITNQYGPNKVSVYGFGSFPLQEKAIEDAKKRDLDTKPDQEAQTETKPEPGKEEQ